MPKRTFANRHTRKNDRIGADPAISTDPNWPRVLNIISSALDFDLVGCSIDAHSGSKHSSVANLDEAAIQDATVEVRVEALPNFDIATIIDLPRVRIVSVRWTSESRL